MKVPRAVLSAALVSSVLLSCKRYGAEPLVQDRGRCPHGLVENTGLAAPFCRPPHSMKQGEPCSSDENCLGTMTCNRGYRNGNCQPERSAKEHEACQDDRDCQPGLLCNGSSIPPERAGKCHQAGAL